MKAGEWLNLAETGARKGGKGIWVISVCLLVTITTTETSPEANNKNLKTTLTTGKYPADVAGGAAASPLVSGGGDVEVGTGIIFSDSLSAAEAMDYG